MTQRRILRLDAIETVATGCDRPAPGARRGGTLAVAVAAAIAALAVLAWWQPIAERGARFLDAWIAAQQAMLAASGNLDADGRAEFAVLLDDGADGHAFRAALARLDGVRYVREAALPGWLVIETDAGDRAGLDAVRSLAATRLVVPNRGLWICH